MQRNDASYPSGRIVEVLEYISTVRVAVYTVSRTSHFALSTLSSEMVSTGQGRGKPSDEPLRTGRNPPSPPIYREVNTEHAMH